MGSGTWWFLVTSKTSWNQGGRWPFPQAVSTFVPTRSQHFAMTQPLRCPEPWGITGPTQGSCQPPRGLMKPLATATNMALFPRFQGKQPGQASGHRGFPVTVLGVTVPESPRSIPKGWQPRLESFPIPDLGSQKEAGARSGGGWKGGVAWLVTTLSPGPAFPQHGTRGVLLVL